MKVKILFLALLVAFVSCKKDDDDTQTPEAVQYLTVGHNWVYDFEMVAMGITMSGEMTYEVMEKMDNGTYRVVETTAMTGFPAQSDTYYWTEDDVFGIGHDMSNLSVGDSWDETEDGITYTTTVVATGVNVTVPAGTFSCVKLKSTESDSDVEGFSYFNESYGMIKTEATVEEEEEGVVYTVNVTMELKSKNF